MTDPESPLKRSISLSNLVRGLIALFAFIAVGAAFAAGRIGLAIAGVLFFVVAASFGYWVWHLRQSAAGHTSPRKPL